MQTDRQISKQQIIQKLAILDSAKATLLEEFVGIDGVIEAFIESARTWFVLPSVQGRPLVVNLWGMTGVGKTSLVRRFCELVEMENALYPLDMGNSNDGGASFYHTLDEVFEHNSGRPFVLLFDEFQHARSKQKGEDRIVGRMGNVWKMLDSGKLEMHDFSSSVNILQQRLKLLKLCLLKGVVVKDGYVVEGLELFCNITNERIENADTILKRDRRTGIPRRQKNNQNKLQKSLPFFPSYDWDEVLELSRGGFDTEYQVQKHLEQLDGEQTIAFLEALLEDAKRPKILDCTKALIVIAGNLDEAYRMAGDKNPDVPADIWKKLTNDISLNHIKDALSIRFRDEHIARLGNNHIIYPAMGESDFKAYIVKRTDAIAKSFEAEHQVRLILSRSVLRIIFQEGVYPTQGFRPVNTTIDRFIQNNLSEILGHVLIDFPHADSVKVSFRSQSLFFCFMNGNEQLGQKSKKVRLDLQNKRLAKRDNKQAVTSVHEAGHAVCSALLLGDVPEIAVSATSSTNSGGFVIRTGKIELVQRSQLIRLVAFHLGGYVAEKLVFGEENVTTGSSSDIHGCSTMVRGILESCGFELGPALFDTKNTVSSNGVIDHKGELDQLVLKYLKEGEGLANETLRTEHELLTRLSEKLFRKGSLRKREIAGTVDRYAKLNAQNRAEQFPFKSILEEKIRLLDGLQKVA